MYNIYAAYDPTYKAFHQPFITLATDEPHVIREFKNGQHTDETELYKLGSLGVLSITDSVMDFAQPIFIITKNVPLHIGATNLPHGNTQPTGDQD